MTISQNLSLTNIGLRVGPNDVGDIKEELR